MSGRALDIPLKFRRPNRRREMVPNEPRRKAPRDLGATWTRKQARAVAKASRARTAA